jgi:mRNA degradation ribonuclease J1/J2
MKERKNLANNGYLEVTIIINDKGKVVKKANYFI